MKLSKTKPLLDETKNFSCTVDALEINSCGMQAENRAKKNFSNLVSLKLINCTNMLDYCGSENLPTSGALTFSALEMDSYQILNKFMHTTLLSSIDEFIDLNEVQNEGLHIGEQILD